MSENEAMQNRGEAGQNGLPHRHATPSLRRVTWPPDYHMHTPLCRHAVGEPTEYAARALELGFKEIGFSDHAPMPVEDFDDWRMPARSLDQYVEKVQRARRENPTLRILMALEVDFIPGYEEWIKDISARHPWDYLIGSVHYVAPGFDIDNPTKLSQWRKHDPYEVWSLYFERLTQAAESGFFQIIGHADLPKKFNILPKRDTMPLVENFLKAAARKGVAMEINTSGLRKECKEMYPSPAIVRAAQLHGVPLTFGSDAHAPGELGLNFKEAVELAKASGYTHFARCEARGLKPERLA